MAKRSKNQHYVDNAKFLEVLIQYKARVQRAADAGKEKPRIDEYLGECFLKIATHLSYRPNFINYMYKDDMIADGYENCVQYIDNFNPEKSKNPFAYFTQIVYYAFLRRIAKEKRQQAIREKIVEKSGFDQVFHTDDSSDTAVYNGIKSRIEMNNRY